MQVMEDIRSLQRIAREELRKERRENALRSTFFLLSIVSALFLLILVVSYVSTITGNATYVDSQAGYITTLQLHGTVPVFYWSGLYGFALTVSGLSEQFSTDVDSGEINRFDVFFGCLQQDAPGGPEIYASPSSSLDFSEVSPATFEMIDTYSNCTALAYCANGTFTQNTSVMVGTTNITDVPGTFTYKFDGDNDVFLLGALNVSGELAFFASVGNIQKGFTSNVTVNYQMMLPTPVNSSVAWYFYADPNDECPGGGIGNTVNASMYGYVLDSGGAGLANATVNVAGYIETTDESGFYNVTFNVLPGTYNVIVQKSGYQTHIDNVTVDFNTTSVEKNFTLSEIVDSDVVSPLVYGVVRDDGNSVLSEANVSFGSNTTASNSSGQYAFRPTVLVGLDQPIVASKTGYDNYVAYVNVSSNTTEIEHNITMEQSNLNQFPTGPDPDEGDSDGTFDEIQEQAEELGQDFWISTDRIDIQVRRNTFVEQKIAIYNFKSSSISTTFSLSSDLTDFIKLDKTSMSLGSDSTNDVTVTIYGTRPLGIYEGELTIAGDLDQEIPIRVEIVDRRVPIETLLLDIDLLKSVIRPGGLLKYRLHLQNLLTDQNYKITLTKAVVSEGEGDIIIEDDSEDVEIENSLTLLRELQLPKDIDTGNYLLRANAQFFSLFLTVEEPFIVANPIYLYSFFGIPLWVIFVIISALSFILFNFLLYKKYVNKKKRYHLALNPGLLPKDGPRSIKLGRIAETKLTAYYDLDMLTTHAIIAGATGGGKSISAQVLIEEALLKNIAVIVFDPTAQWSGMLRKCEDKKMMSFYSKFGLKPTDARAFPGNVRQIVNERQYIDVNKFMNPGQIQIFTLNKLDPAKMDVFVAGIIASIFRSDPKEHPGLKAILVFDEVHRLLPKFGGSGKGFLQIERACREFRKWGLGVMLVSQVLSDFVGEIKANINTEMQMRVAEENDLARIKERYGLDALKSLVRADVGVGMFQNAEYNRGLPYFINLRPILHSTRRLSDEVLEKYNKYNDVIDDLEYSIQQLEDEKVDTFDLKMELKLVKDKLMTGNFTVVDIYLEGLKPRLEKQWEKIGKKPKKREIKLVDLREMEASLAAAQKERDKWNKKNNPGGGGGGEEKKEEKKADPLAKIVAPITFDNGMMVSSLKELKDVLPNLDNSVLAIHVNDNKHDIAKWAGEQVDKGLGEKLQGAKTKEAIIKELDAFAKGGDKKKEGDGKEEKKKEGGDTEKEGKKKDGAKGGTEKESGEEKKADESKEDNDKKEGAEKKVEKKAEKSDEKKEETVAAPEKTESKDDKKPEEKTEKQVGKKEEKPEAKPEGDAKTEEKQTDAAKKDDDKKESGAKGEKV